MTSRVDGGAGAAGRSLHGLTQVGSTNQNLDLVRDVYRYQLLYDNVIRSLQAYTNLYTQSSYKELKEAFTQKKYNDLIGTNRKDNYYNTAVDELIDFSYNSFTFSQYRSNIYSIVTGLQNAIIQYDSLEACKAKSAEQSALLKDKDQLIQYIKTQFKDKYSTDAFYISETYSTDLFLKPWYSLYLQVHGAPPNGVFDAERMATIVEVLIKRGDITMEDFING